MIRLVSTLTLLLALATTAHAFRMFPDNAQLAELRGFAYPQVNLDGKILAVGPGLRIYDERNRIITHAMLQKKGPVAYLLGSNQEVAQIWLISEQEKSQLEKAIAQRETLKKQLQNK